MKSKGLGQMWKYSHWDRDFRDIDPDEYPLQPKKTLIRVFKRKYI